MADPHCDAKIALIKIMWVLFCALFQEMRHINFFLWAQKWGILGGGQRVDVEKVYVLFLSPSDVAARFTKDYWPQASQKMQASLGVCAKAS